MSKPMLTETMESERNVKLFRNGRNQALRIPKEFELPGKEAVLRKEGNRLIVEPLERRSLRVLLNSWAPTKDKLPDVDAGLPALDDITL
jgi:antitoxin VapB